MKTRRREIAKAGIFGSKDNPQIVTEKDLKEIAETFPEIGKAPVSLNGHWPDASSPRLGNVVGVSYDENTKTLTGEIEEEDALAESVDAGYYPDVSIGARQRAADGKMYLHHLAYLGEEPPAIKDLVKEIRTELGIAAGDSAACRILPPPSGKQLYLSDTPPENLGGDARVQKENAVQADRLAAKKDDRPASGAGGGGGSAKINDEEASVMTEEEAQKLREENERLKKEAEAKDLALSDAAEQRRKAARGRLKSVMEEKGIPKPVQEKALSLSDSLEGGKAIELSDSEAPEGKRKVSPADCLVEIVSAFTRPVETGAMNLSDGGDAAGSAGNAGRIDFAKI